MIYFRLAITQVYLNEGNDEHRRKDFSIFTIQYPVPLFSLCTKSLIAGLKNANQLSEENGGGPFC